MAEKLSKERQKIADAVASLQQDTTDIHPRTAEATEATKQKVLATLANSLLPHST